MSNRFLGLRHDAVIRSHHQHHQIGGLRAACTHGGKCLVAWRIQEGNDALRGLNVIGADMLGNPAGFAGGDSCLANGIEQRGFAVVYMAHDSDNGRTLLRDRVRVLIGRNQIRLRIIRLGGFGGVAHFTDENHRGFLIEHLIDGDHRSHFHHHLDNLSGFNGHFLREFTNADGLRNQHFADNGFGRRLEIAFLTIITVMCLGLAATPTLATARCITTRFDRAALVGIVGP